MKHTNRTFRQIVSAEAESNLQSLMRRAQTANRLAKTVSRQNSRTRAYAVKNKTLIGLKQNFADRVQIRRDWKHGAGIVLVEVNTKCFGLHSPAENFGY